MKILQNSMQGFQYSLSGKCGKFLLYSTCISCVPKLLGGIQSSAKEIMPSVQSSLLGLMEQFVLSFPCMLFRDFSRPPKSQFLLEAGKGVALINPVKFISLAFPCFNEFIACLFYKELKKAYTVPSYLCSQLH